MFIRKMLAKRIVNFHVFHAELYAFIGKATEKTKSLLIIFKSTPSHTEVKVSPMLLH
jgi:hypothetical protein